MIPAQAVEALAEVIWGVEVDEVGTFKTGVTSEAADKIAHAILAAGWRPPTPPAHAIEQDHQAIPAEAVEAAAIVLWDKEMNAPWSSVADGFKAPFRRDAKLALEAAAPFMRRVVSSVEELHALPGGTVVMAGDETVLEKSYIEPQWWHTMGSYDATSIDDIKLPATVLHRPTK